MQIIPAAPKGLEIRQLNFEGLREGMRKLSRSKNPPATAPDVFAAFKYVPGDPHAKTSDGELPLTECGW